MQIIPNTESKKIRCEAFLDNSLLEHTRVVEIENGFSLHVHSHDNVLKVVNTIIKKVIQSLEIILIPKKNIKLNQELEKLKSIGINFTSIYFSKKNEEIYSEVCFGLKIKPFLWREKYNFVDYCSTIVEVSEANSDSNFRTKRSGQGIKVFFDGISQNYTIGEIILKSSDNLLSLHRKVAAFLTNQNKITSTFNFPEEMKVACEQYLLYFAQFLQDLGINATSNLKEEAGKVLFSVTPTDDVEALDKIHEALAVYLNLPTSPIEYDESFAAMRLQQQVENLQHSQRMAVREIRTSEKELRLAQTVIEHQDKVIFQKDSIIGQKDKIIEKISSKSIMTDSLEKNDEFEIVCNGLEVTHSKWLLEKTGIKSNPVTLLKSLGKKLTGKDNEITSINLNREVDSKDI